MIRDPSDGSEKPMPSAIPTPSKRPTSAENWGLKSLDRPVKQPIPAPTAEELRLHYAKFKLAFEPKEGE